MTHERLRALLVLAILALATLPRLLPLDSHGLWLDEIGTLWVAQGASTWESTQRAWFVQGQTPLYFLALRAWTGLFGDGELALRLPSLLAGVATLAIGYASLRHSAGRRAGIAAVVLLGTNPLLVFLSHQARPYAIAALGVLLAHWGLSRALRTNAIGDRLLGWGGALLAAYCSPLCAPVGACLLLGVHATPLAERRYPLRTAWLDGIVALLAVTPVLWHMASLLNRRGSLQTYLPNPDTWIFVSLLPGLLPVIGLGALVFGYRKLRSSTRPPAPPAARGVFAFELGCVVFLVGGLFLGLALGTNLLVARYVLLSVLGGSLLMARLIGRLPWPVAALALGCAVLAPQATVARAPRPWPEWRELRKELERSSPPSELVVIRSGFIEAESLLDPPHTLGPWRDGFMKAPVLNQPHDEPSERTVLQLPFHWGVNPNQGAYFEHAFGSALDQRDGFAVIASRNVVADFAGWLAWRFPDRFAVASISRPFRVSNREQVLLVRLKTK